MNIRLAILLVCVNVIHAFQKPKEVENTLIGMIEHICSNDSECPEGYQCISIPKLLTNFELFPTLANKVCVKLSLPKGVTKTNPNYTVTIEAAHVIKNKSGDISVSHTRQTPDKYEIKCNRTNIDLEIGQKFLFESRINPSNLVNVYKNSHLISLTSDNYILIDSSEPLVEEMHESFLECKEAKNVHLTVHAFLVTEYGSLLASTRNPCRINYQCKERKQNEASPNPSVYQNKNNQHFTGNELQKYGYNNSFLTSLTTNSDRLVDDGIDDANMKPKPKITCLPLTITNRVGKRHVLKFDTDLYECENCTSSQVFMASKPTPMKQISIACDAEGVETETVVVLAKNEDQTAVETCEVTIGCVANSPPRIYCNNEILVLHRQYSTDTDLISVPINIPSNVLFKVIDDDQDDLNIVVQTRDSTEPIFKLEHQCNKNTIYRRKVIDYIITAYDGLEFTKQVCSVDFSKF